MVSGKFVANGSELRLKGNSTVLVPKNGYFDMMADTNIQVEPSDATRSFALINEGFISYRTCDMHTLEIKGGGFMQTENGNVEVTLSNSSLSRSSRRNSSRVVVTDNFRERRLYLL